MTNSEKILYAISLSHQEYRERNRDDYASLCNKHQAIIDFISDNWIDSSLQRPNDKERIFGIQDLKSIKPSLGRFVSDFYFDNGEFVVNLGDCDPYRCISHWISFSELDKLDFRELMHNYLN